MVGIRETPFGDSVDEVYLLVFVALSLGLLVVTLGLLLGDSYSFGEWLTLAAAAGTVTGLLSVHAYAGQRRLVADLAAREDAPLTSGRPTAVDGELSGESGALRTPVRDDIGLGTARAIQPGAGPPATVERPVTPGFDGSTAEKPSAVDTDPGPDVTVDLSVLPVDVGERRFDFDHAAPTRRYDLDVTGRVARPFKKTRSVGSERRRSDPLLVEAGAETVDLADTPLTIPQAETATLNSGRLSVEDGRVELGTANPAADATDAGVPEPEQFPVTAAFLDRTVGDSVDSLTTRLAGGVYEVTGTCWPVADGEPVYVLGTFERASAGRLVPDGEVTVGRGRFADRLDEERARLQRWERRLRFGTVLLVAGLAGLAVLHGVV